MFGKIHKQMLAKTVWLKPALSISCSTYWGAIGKSINEQKLKFARLPYSAVKGLHLKNLGLFTVVHNNGSERTLNIRTSSKINHSKKIKKLYKTEITQFYLLPTFTTTIIRTNNVINDKFSGKVAFT